MNKKSIIILIVAILVITLIIGIVFVVKGGNSKTTEKLDYANMTAEDLLAKIKDRNNVTADEYAWLISTYSYVNIDDDMKLEKNITDEALKSIDSKAKPEEKYYIEKLLKSESPQVRAYAYTLMPSITGISKENIEFVKEAIKTETNEYVLYNIVKAVSNEAKSSKEIADFLIKMASNENAKVRQQAAIALANPWSKGVEGVTDTVIKLMNDGDIEVRKIACQNSGRLGDEAVIDPLVNILNKSEDADVHGSCVEGLVYLWYDFPSFKNTSEKAYNATMDYLKKTPRTDKTPSWIGVGSFKTTSKQQSFADWKQKATYFNTDDIYSVMIDIIKDENANYLARTAAMDEIKSHCTTDQFNSLKLIIEGLTDKKANAMKTSYESKLKQ